MQPEEQAIMENALKLANQTQLIEVIREIEKIVSDDCCFSLYYDLRKGKLNKDETQMAEKLEAIYRISHAYAGECGNKHENWKVKK